MIMTKKSSDDHEYSEGELVEISTYNSKENVYDKGYRYIGRVKQVFEHTILMQTENNMKILVEKTNPSLKHHHGG